jgi:hypothetical protein
MWGWIRITKNCSAMHRGIALHLFNEEIPPSSLPSLYRFTTWLLVLLVASSSSLSLHDVDCSVLFFLVFTKCCLSWLSIIFTSSILILSIYFLVCNSFPSCCDSPNLGENIWLLDHQLLPVACCPTLSESFTSHLVHMVGDVMWLIVESNFLHRLFPLSLSWFIDV